MEIKLMEEILAVVPGDKITLKKPQFGEYFFPTPEQIEAHRTACDMGTAHDEKGNKLEFDLTALKGNPVNTKNVKLTHDIHMGYYTDGAVDILKPPANAEQTEICFCFPEHYTKSLDSQIEYGHTHAIWKRDFDKVAQMLVTGKLSVVFPKKAEKAEVPTAKKAGRPKEEE